jgi:hypothetical protein
LHCPKKLGTGGISFFIFSLCAIFLNFMLLNVNFRAISLIESIKILGAALFSGSRDGRQPEAQKFLGLRFAPLLVGSTSDGIALRWNAARLRSVCVFSLHAIFDPVGG